MKKIILLLLLLPLIGFSQTDLVRWNGSGQLPSATILASNVTSGNITGQNVNFAVLNWGNPNAFHSSAWPNSSSPDFSKFIQLQIGVNSGYSLNLSSLNFDYLVDGNDGPSKYQVRYAFNSGFSNSQGTLLETVNTVKNSVTTKSINLSGITVVPGQILYIRIYAYDRPVSWNEGVLFRLAHGLGGNIGPVINGTVATYSTTLAAFNDSFTNNINTAANHNVLSNDVAGSTAVNNVTVTTNPAHGTATVNTDKTIKYTPAIGFIGTDVYKYTITNTGGQTATATVTVLVKGTTPSGALNGTYYVGTNGHFTSITAAVNYLNTASNGGVTGPVTFLLKDVIYNNTTGEVFPITINQFAGSSTANTVTFKPAPTINARIEAFHINSYTPVYSVFNIYSSDNIIFDGSNTVNGTTRNLTIINSSFVGGETHDPTQDSSNRAVLWLTNNGTNGATNITVKNTNIRQKYKNAGYAYCMGIFAGGNNMISDSAGLLPTSTGNNSNLTVLNNDFENVKEAVFVNASSNYTTNVTIRQNDLGAENNQETIILPAYLNNVNGFDFSNNLIYNLRRETTAGALLSAGIYVKGNSQNGTITNNNMKNLIKTTTDATSFGGIVLESVASPSNITVANNFIANVAGNNNGGSLLNGHGIVLVTGNAYKIYHNTVSLNTNQSANTDQPVAGGSVGYSSALYVNEGVTAIDVRNNIFANSQTLTSVRRTAIAVRTHLSNINSVFSHLNYNTYFSTDKTGFIARQGVAGNIDYFDSPDYVTTFSTWKSDKAGMANINTNDAHSIDATPIFVSLTDLHLTPNNPSLDNRGIFIAAVTKDIDGQLRNTITPDMGADEFGAITVPAAGSNAGIYCTSSTTWDGTQWSNGMPTAEKDAIFTGNYTHAGTNGTFNACSVFVQGTAQVNFTNNSNAVVVHNVNVANTAALTFESSSNLIQVTNTINTGEVTIKRNGSELKRLDYTLWSSPVTGTQTMKQFSPFTSANRFYTYATLNNYYLDIADINTATFARGKGYLIRMPNSLPTISGYNEGTATVKFEGIFKGTPNNGNVSIPLEFYGELATGYNAVGNPYPSPISITDFIDANIDNITGTIWIWRKTNDPTKRTYCVATKAGYVANNAPGGGGQNGNNGNNLIKDPFEIDPSGVLNTGQGFIVQATSANKELVFRNNMRKQINYNNFFRNGELQESENQFMQANRVWINLINADGAFAQTLIAYLPEATTGYDNGIDGKSFADGDINIYTIAGDKNLAIQGRPAFTNTDEVALGFKSATAGTFEFTIDHAGGLFAAGQDVFVKDNVTGTLHNLKNGNYSFQSDAGSFNERFTIVYKNVNEPVAGINDNIATEKAVTLYQSGKQISIKATQAIKAVTVYDITGRMVYSSNNINATDFTTSGLDTAQQVLIVKTELDNRQVVSKKFMMK